MRTIQSMEEKYLLPALELVEQVFTDYESAEEGKLVPGGLDHIHGQVAYTMYDSLR